MVIFKGVEVVPISVNFYNTISEKNRINKSIILKKSNISCQFTDPCDMYNPEIILSESEFEKRINYAYIEEWGLYYFITGCVFDNGFVRYILVIDPLMSYRSDILNSSVIADRSSNNYNDYLVDELQSPTNNTKLKITRFPFEFKGRGSYTIRIGGRI